MRESQVRFTRQQGCSAPDSNNRLYAALMFQPRIVGCLVVLGVLLQSPWLFLALSAVLWWNALIPTHNPFDAIYNHVVAYPRGLLPLGVAPEPRRFAQGMAATFALAIGAALFLGAATMAWVLEGLLGSAVMALVFGRFCVGSYVYHLLQRGLVLRREARGGWMESLPTQRMTGHGLIDSVPAIVPETRQDDVS